MGFPGFQQVQRVFDQLENLISGQFQLPGKGRQLVDEGTNLFESLGGRPRNGGCFDPHPNATIPFEDSIGFKAGLGL
jgi:hypothetical protein